MSLKIKNKRLERQVIDVKDDSGKKRIAENFSSVFNPFRELHSIRKKYLLIMLIVNILAFVGIAFVLSGVHQGLCIVTLFVLNMLAAFIFSFFVRRKGVTYIHTVALFLVVLSIMSLIISLTTFLKSNEHIAVNSEIAEIKKNSQLLISTDDADIYLDQENMKIYSVSDMFGSKYINKSYLTLAKSSEYYDLYNLGMEIKPNIEGIDEVYVYPPTPHTITGYEYLIEIKIENNMYVSRVFIPGVVDFNHNATSHVIDIAYSSDSETMYEVYKVDQYLLFQSEYSSFSTPYENVAYNENEYFFVRYNRYLKAYSGEEDVDEIEEENVRFINSLLVISPTIKKVNFFWIGDLTDDTFTAYLPVIEIVYMDGTSDIAIIKDINAGAVQEILGY